MAAKTSGSINCSFSGMDGSSAFTCFTLNSQSLAACNLTSVCLPVHDDIMVTTDRYAPNHTNCSERQDEIRCSTPITVASAAHNSILSSEGPLQATPLELHAASQCSSVNSIHQGNEYNDLRSETNSLTQVSSTNLKSTSPYSSGDLGGVTHEFNHFVLTSCKDTHVESTQENNAKSDSIHADISVNDMNQSDENYAVLYPLSSDDDTMSSISSQNFESSQEEKSSSPKMQKAISQDHAPVLKYYTNTLSERLLTLKPRILRATTCKNNLNRDKYGIHAKIQGGELIVDDVEPSEKQQEEREVSESAVAPTGQEDVDNGCKSQNRVTMIIRDVIQDQTQPVSVKTYNLPLTNLSASAAQHTSQELIQVPQTDTNVNDSAAQEAALNSWNVQNVYSCEPSPDIREPVQLVVPVIGSRPEHFIVGQDSTVQEIKYLTPITKVGPEWQSVKLPYYRGHHEVPYASTPFANSDVISVHQQTANARSILSSSSRPSLNSTGNSDVPSPTQSLSTSATRSANSLENECDDDDDDDDTASLAPLKIPTASQLNAALYNTKDSALSDGEFDFCMGREAHNAKERARRSRIKIACEQLKDIVPGMTAKTDKATVFEYAVHYIDYLRMLSASVYPDCDKDFLKQCSLYRHS